jgi:peptidase M28-like protein
MQNAKCKMQTVRGGCILLWALFVGVPAAELRGQAPAAAARPDVAGLVSRLDLERYKATIKELTKFGDRQQGTDRNRAAIDWIEAQLRSYGCATERLNYVFNPAPPAAPGAAAPAARPSPVVASGEIRRGQGGSRLRGVTRPTGVNRDPMAQPDEALRQLDSQPTTPGPRQEVFCTKVGAVRPQEMYIVSAHMDGIGLGEAANDDGSGTALVMELARVLNAPDVQTERTIRFVLWNNEETGLNGAQAYIEQRAGLQGREDPAGSGRYPEPRWLGIIQHDMLLFDHGMPRADGSLSPEQRPEADVNVEFQSTSRFAEDAMKLAFALRDANERYASDYPAAVGSHMTNTDSNPFMDFVPAISVRENERGMHIGAGWDPHWHQPTDRYATFSDKDFRLGLNAAQTTLGAVAELSGASLKR